MRRKNVKPIKTELPNTFEVRWKQNESSTLAPAKLVVALIGLFLVGLWLLAGSATDVYRSSVRLRKTKQQGEQQIVEGTAMRVEHPWFAFPLGRGGRIWYRVRYRFAAPDGRIVEGEDCIRTRRSYAPNILVAYQPADPSTNRIYEKSESLYLALQAAAGAVCVLAGGFLVFFSCEGFRMFS